MKNNTIKNIALKLFLAASSITAIACGGEKSQNGGNTQQQLPKPNNYDALETLLNNKVTSENSQFAIGRKKHKEAFLNLARSSQSYTDVLNRLINEVYAPAGKFSIPVGTTDLGENEKFDLIADINKELFKDSFGNKDFSNPLDTIFCTLNHGLSCKDTGLVITQIAENIYFAKFSAKSSTIGDTSKKWKLAVISPKESTGEVQINYSALLKDEPKSIDIFSTSYKNTGNLRGGYINHPSGNLSKSNWKHYLMNIENIGAGS